MTFSQTILRGLLAFIATCIVQVIAGMLVPMKPIALPHFLLWVVLSTAVSVAALSGVAARSEWRGWRLGTAVAAFPLLVTSVNFIEGVVFLTNSQVQWTRVFLYTVISAILSIPVWMLLFGGPKRTSSDHYPMIRSKSRGERAWKFVLSDVSYVFLYFLAGTIIFPYVKDFYATQHLPSTGQLVALQLLVRGPVFILMVLGLARMLGLPRVSGALAVAAVFTLLTGVVPLLMPNPYFPDSVRWVHMCEVTSSNFVFSAFVAWLWGRPEPAREVALRHAA